MQIVDLTDPIRAALDARLSGMHFCLPGKVVSYDSAAGTAKVRVGINRPVPTDVEGEFVTESIPTVPDVPVIWPGSSGGHLATGLSAGDSVLLLVSDLDPSTWVRTGEVSDPADLRKCSLAHALCLPWAKGYQPTDPDLVARTAAIGGNSNAAALSSVVDAILGAISACTPSGTETGLAAVKAALAAYTTSASVKLKLGG